MWAGGDQQGQTFSKTPKWLGLLLAINAIYYLYGRQKHSLGAELNNG